MIQRAYAHEPQNFIFLFLSKGEKLGRRVSSFYRQPKDRNVFVFFNQF